MRINKSMDKKLEKVRLEQKKWEREPFYLKKLFLSPIEFYRLKEKAKGKRIGTQAKKRGIR